MFQPLLSNFLATAFLVSIWAYLAADLSSFRKSIRAVIAGALMGVGSICSMIFAAQLDTGVIVDMRAVPIAVAALFGGPIAAMVAAAAAGAFRIFIGGAGTEAGLVAISLAAFSGLLARFYFRANKGPTIKLFAFALMAGILPLLAMVMVRPSLEVIVILGALNFLGAMAASVAIFKGEERASERTLLLAAIRNAPEFLYIKDPRGRFVTFSKSVADVHGVEQESDLVGKTDPELDGERGRMLLAEELEIISKRMPSVEKLERLPDAHGAYRWFATSKAPVFDVDGEALGLVGVTRDVTAERTAREATEAVVDQLSRILAEMANGVALFDFDMRLVFCNEQYHRMFPRTRDVRVPNTRLEDILRTALKIGEQTAQGDDPEAWIRSVVEAVSSGGEEEIRLADGRALIVRNRTVEGFGHVSVVSDVTDIRSAEDRLAAAAEQLRVLASTDPLTGLANRRALTELLDREVVRTARLRCALSAIMIDVDHFKAFNDTHGHQAGDRCLQLIADVLQDTASRGTDIVARYGGEEFCIILPETDARGAFGVAERIRLRIEALAVPGEGGATTHVTASFGIATIGRDEEKSELSTEELITGADRALYLAKSRGRNRVEIFSDATDEPLADAG